MEIPSFSEHLADQQRFPQGFQGWITLLLDPLGQICIVPFRAGLFAILMAISFLHWAAFPSATNTQTFDLSPGLSLSRVAYESQVNLVISALAAYPLLILLVKRLRDLARPIWLAVLVLLPHYIFFVLAACGFTVMPGITWGAPVIVASPLDWLLLLARAVTVAWIVAVPFRQRGWLALPGVERLTATGQRVENSAKH